MKRRSPSSLLAVVLAQPRRLSGQSVQGHDLDQEARAIRARRSARSTELEQLGDPSAIEALGEAWVDQGKPVRLLQVIISLARPLTPEQAKAKYVTDYEATGRPASWDKALPYLKQGADRGRRGEPALGRQRAEGGRCARRGASSPAASTR